MCEQFDLIQCAHMVRDTGHCDLKNCLCDFVGNGCGEGVENLYEPIDFEEYWETEEYL
jgi:hypothetical protein